MAAEWLHVVESPQVFGISGDRYPPSPATSLDAEILEANDLVLDYDAENFCGALHHVRMQPKAHRED
jgi:hypothetical protein